MFKRDHKTAQMGKEILPFRMGYLPEFFQKKSEVELHDTTENRKHGIKVLRTMIENDGFFSTMSFDDDFLLQFLRCRKFNINRAFVHLKAAAKFREKNKKLFRELYFEKIAITTRKKIVTFLPYRCQDGCAILYVQLDNWDPEEFPIEQVKRMVIILLLQALRDPMTQVNGFKVIFDVKSNPIRHIKHCTPHNLYLLYYGTQECAPGRFKEIHIMNKSTTARVAWAVIQLFMSPKVKSRVTFHDDPKELLEYFSPCCLPTQYGGDLKDFDLTDWLKDVMSPEKLDTLGGGKF